MTSSYDATGALAKFLYSEYFMIRKADQVIHLSFPAYYRDPAGSSYRPTVIATVVDAVSGEATQQSVEWDRVESDEDDQAISDAILGKNAEAGIASNWNPQIMNYIKVKGFGTTFTSQFKVKVTYQRLRYDELKVDETWDGDGPRYSPALMAKVLNRIAALESSSTDKNLFGTSMDAADILDEDLTGVAPENYVQYELHDINTAAGINLIQPCKGSFYPSNLKVITYEPENFTLTDTESARAKGKDNLFIYTDTSYVGTSSVHMATEYKVILTEATMTYLLGLEQFNGAITGKLVNLNDTTVKELVKGTDYEVDSLDVGRTARTTSTMGVYQNIRFLSAQTGQILISYQAFGGMVAAEDIRNLHQSITNTRSILTGADLLTADALSQQTAILAINKRLRRMEEYHNHFSQVEHRISIMNPGFHWFNIAAIYDVDWGTALRNIHDIGQFRIQSALHKWAYEFMVDVDMTRPSNDILKLRTLGTNQDAGYNPDDYTRVLFRDNLAVRLCWINDGNESGVVLQIGWNFNGYQGTDYSVDTDTIVVTNKSGSSSLWVLLSDPDETNYPSEGLIQVYQHTKYALTTDTHYINNKKYFRYQDMFLYVKTADKYTRDKKYYTYSYNQATGKDEYLAYTVATGTSVDSLADEGITLFEKVLYGHYISAMVSGTDYTVGGDIPGSSIYEVDSTTYSEDTAFSMPNNEFVWREGYASNNSCVKLLEPENGIITWVGNINLTEFAPSFGECSRCDSQNYDAPVTSTKGTPVTYETVMTLCCDLQTYLKATSVSGVSLVLFDRVDGRYVNVYGKTAIADNCAFTEILFNLEDLCGCSIKLSKIELDNSHALLRQKFQLEKTIAPTADKNYVTYDFKPMSQLTGKSLLFAAIKPFLGTYSLKNKRFDLRQIRLHF